MCRAQDLINSEQLNDPNTTVKYAQAIVEAANETGLNFCIPVVVLSNLTGSVLFYKDYHTGPQADEPDGCLPNFQQASAPPGAPNLLRLPADRQAHVWAPGAGQQRRYIPGQAPQARPERALAATSM